MVIVTKSPVIDATQAEMLKQAEHVSNTITATHLELCRDVMLKASAIEKTHENARNYRSEVPTGLYHCKELMKIAMCDKEPILLKQCCEFLISKLKITNALEVFAFLREVDPPNDGKPIPSAPPIFESDAHRWDEFSAEAVADVKRRCDDIINTNAYEVFQLTCQVAMLSYNDLQEILRRDELCIQQEELLYNAMYDWARCRCPYGDRRKFFKATLRDLPMLIRYGLMKPKTFKNLKGLRDFLDEKDWRRVRFHVEEKAKGREVHSLPYGWSRPRTLPSEETQKIIDQFESMRMTESFGLQCLACWMIVFD